MLRAQHAPASATTAAATPYAPYEFLVGDWDVGAEGQPPSLVMRLRWGGTLRGYLFYSTSLLRPDGEEELHFEGMLIWNALAQHLEMLLTLDPVNGTTLEKGRMFVQPDGVVVREISAIGPQAVRGPDGKPTAGAASFRQTFKQIDHDTVRTEVMRQTADGWGPTFPGSDKLVMKRRAASTRGH
jgi:hypothetical protein